MLAGILPGCLPPWHAGLASLQLEFDARKNPAIFDQLLAHTPASLIARGRPILAEQQRLVTEAVGQAFEVRLGGAAHVERDWGRCLAVTVGEELARLRSQLGNALAEESARRGLRAMGLVAYVEVGAGGGQGWRETGRRMLLEECVHGKPALPVVGQEGAVCRPYNQTLQVAFCLADY